MLLMLLADVNVVAEVVVGCLLVPAVAARGTPCGAHVESRGRAAGFAASAWLPFVRAQLRHPRRQCSASVAWLRPPLPDVCAHGVHGVYMLYRN